MDATLIVSRDGTTERARRHRAMKEELAPVAADLNCAREFAGLEVDSDDQASYERQRYRCEEAARPDQGLDAAVDLMRAEMSAGRPWLSPVRNLNV